LKFICGDIEVLVGAAGAATIKVTYLELASDMATALASVATTDICQKTISAAAVGSNIAITSSAGD